ncbi:flagellar biosynthesis protein FliO [Curtobacterium sp. AG1037]|uniref:FliO/MopB family protein n=1 Tax=Curtobacterium sp. AG1037 TaxID=2183990 RepID=UPI000E0C9A3C|nr:flagellar biosynthetic protein FliO [Curtobacterium sp. AG1037]RDH96162.1 flagellar biosynthesis protein FliO [Curtobacterium sp. AG1037]
MDTLVIVLRVALSLGVVLALMWVLHRRVSKGQLGRPKARGRRAASVEVVGRTGIGGKASVVVVDVEGERLVLGVSEHGVALLTSGQAPAPEPELAIVTSADRFRAELEQQDDSATILPVGAADTTEVTAPLPMRPRNRRPQRTVVPTNRQLHGSILSADTWRQAAAALRDRRAG